MAWTQAQFDALDTAISMGALTVRYADRTVTYRSLEEMLKIRDMMADELGLSGVLGSSIRKLSYAKGIE
jgi:hypothetical protein